MKIFYSWQNDIRPNRTFVGDCLETALHGTDWEIDTATRDASGAVDIADNIIEKIEQSEAFIADVSIIGEINGKKVSNPNVMYELGYAAKVLGWDKIILIANRSTTPETRNLPFDIMTRLAIITDMNSQNSQRITDELRRIILGYNPASRHLDRPYIYLERHSSGPQGTVFEAVNDEDERYVLNSIELAGIHARLTRSLEPRGRTPNINVAEIPGRSLEHRAENIRFTVNRLNDTYRITQRVQLEPRADGRFNLMQLEPSPAIIEKIPSLRQDLSVENVQQTGDGRTVRCTDQQTGQTFLLTISGTLLATLGSRYITDSDEYLKRIAFAINNFYEGQHEKNYLFTTFNTDESLKLEDVVDRILSYGAENQKTDES